MRKLTILTLIVCFLFTGTSTTKAEDYDFSDDAKWQETCSVTPEDPNDMILCNMYLQDYSNRLQESIDRSEADIANREELITAVKAQIDTYNNEILSLNNQIDELNAQIDDYQNQIDTIYNNIRTRMASSQGSMHFSNYVSFLMGASDFADIIKRVYIIDTMVNKEKTDSTRLSELQVAVEENKAEVETKLETVEGLKSEAADKKEELQDEVDELNKKLEELEAARVEAVGLIEANEDALRLLNKYVSSNSFVCKYPISSSHITAYVWGYDYGVGFRYHTGNDYGAPYGTPIYAPANGMVWKSYNGCPTDTGKHLYGSAAECGLTTGSGNCIYIMSEVGGSVYVFKFQHLAYNSVTSESVIFQGDYIGKVGASGTATGSHLHIECFYLGEGALSTYFKRTDYNSVFNCGVQLSAMSHRCQYGASAPCRINPQTVLDNVEWWKAGNIKNDVG